MIPTSVTLGKCRPFAIICVPTRMSILPVRKFLKVSRYASLRVMESASIRRTVAFGKMCATVDSDFLGAPKTGPFRIRRPALP